MSQHVTSALRAVLVNSYALSLKLQTYHWNIEGRHFKPLHLLFEEQYDDVSEAIDDLAERLRALDVKVPASFAIFARETLLSEPNESLDENQMVHDAYLSTRQLVGLLQDGVKAAQEAGDEATADLLIGRIAAHDKAAWMLKSSLPDALREEVRPAV